MARENRRNRELRRQVDTEQFAIESSTVQFEHRTGPVPPPEDLAKYNQIAPDLADRLVKMAEAESLHRREVEKIAVNAQIGMMGDQKSQVRTGQWMAFAIAMVGMSLSAYAMTHGAQAGGAVLGGTTLISLVAAFLYRQHAVNQPPKPAPPPPESKANDIELQPLYVPDRSQRSPSP